MFWWHEPKKLSPDAEKLPGKTRWPLDSHTVSGRIMATWRSAGKKGEKEWKHSDHANDGAWKRDVAWHILPTFWGGIGAPAETPGSSGERRGRHMGDGKRRRG